MPTKDFNIRSQGGWTTATFSMTRLENLEWLGGRRYSHLGLYIQNVAHTETVNPLFPTLETADKTGHNIPVLFENMVYPIITGRDELGFSKVFATLDGVRSGNSYVLNAGWEGTSFYKMSLLDLVAEDDLPVEKPPIYHYRLFPRQIIRASWMCSTPQFRNWSFATGIRRDGKLEAQVYRFAIRRARSCRMRSLHWRISLMGWGGSKCHRSLQPVFGRLNESACWL
jgi:hypothetical protein